jgi:SAM-dependent methyltransferase
MTDPETLRIDVVSAARRHAVEPSVHVADFIFQFLASNPVFPSKTEAVNYYFDDGARSCERFRSLISRFVAAETTPVRVLEFASGYGCVSRHLVKQQDLDVTACDIHPAAMSFIAEKMGLKTLQSANVPERFGAPVAFHACFALSFFSHMPDATWERWLRSLLRTVLPGGVLIFTTQGRASAQFFGHPVLDHRGYWFKAESEQKDLNTAEYGQTIVTPSYVFNALHRIEEAEPMLFEGASWWGHQDTYVVKRKV